MFPVPYHDQFIAQLNTNNRQYWSLFDEALQNSRENTYRFSLDPVVNSCLNVRAYPTALLPGDVKPEDEESDEELLAAKRVTADVRSMLGLAAMRRWLLYDSTMSGVSGAQIAYKWQVVKGKLRMRPRAWSPVQGDSLSFDFGGWPAIRIRGGSLTGPQVISSEQGLIYRLTPEERENVIIHRFNPEASDFYRPANARTVIGTGLRGRLYWLWALKTQLWKAGMDWLRWFSRGFTVFYYEYGNAAHLTAVQNAIKAQDGSYAMCYPVMRDGGSQPYFQKPFENIPVSSGNVQFMQQLITQYLDDMMRFVILHQSLTTQVGPSGMASGTVASLHQTTFDNIVKMDALQLDDSFTTDLVEVLYRVNEPGITPGRWVSQLESPNIEQLIQSAQAIVSLGGSVPQRPLLESAGIPDPKPNETILGGLQQGTPTAVTSIPDGTPMLGANPSGLQPLQSDTGGIPPDQSQTPQ